MKITYKEAEQIRKRYSDGNTTMGKLAEEYDVSTPTIWNVLNNKTFISNKYQSRYTKELIGIVEKSLVLSKITKNPVDIAKLIQEDK